MAKTSFNEFLLAVAPEHRVFVEKLNDKLLEQGCELVIKEVKADTLPHTSWRRKP